MATFLIGIDDTDNHDSPGTGKLARQLVLEIERVGGRFLATTGHQFLIDPRIPYTGHNRGICVGIDWEGAPSDLDFVFDLVQHWSAEGSDPGVCLAMANAVTPAVVEWGNRSLREVLTLREAAAIAGDNRLELRPLGGTGGGIIGALASVGLRAGGEVGRFVDMPGLRTLGDLVTVGQLEAMAIKIEYSATAGASRTGAPVKTLGWIRPRLSKGKPLLAVEWSDRDNAWIPVDRKKVHPLE